jgi:hypothetical protein
MYRYTVDNAITYSSEDLVLFRASPFACWMERLTLENPDHGIPPDLDSSTPISPMERQDEIADTLRAEGRRVRLIPWQEVEPARRKATLEAMREGVDFIVNGQLALGPLASPVNLLMRTSGYSELGDFLYIPCDTQVATTGDSTFRLCFLADLLHSLQGQLPPQMLDIRGGVDLVPLPTEEHIYHYRAVKQRFMAAMRDYRKHRMPDPAESAHFGRWSECAREVLKQRLLREEQQTLMTPDGVRGDGGIGSARQPGPGAGGDAPPERVGIGLAEPLRRAAGAGGTSCDLEEVSQVPLHGAKAAARQRQPTVATDQFTLAEQALMLAPGMYTPGPGVHRQRSSAGVSGELRSRPAASTASEKVEQKVEQKVERKVERKVEHKTAEEPAVRDNESGPGSGPKRRLADAALDNLEFIGRSQGPGRSETATDRWLPRATSAAPAPSLRDPRAGVAGRKAIAAPTPGLGRSDRPPTKSGTELTERGRGDRALTAQGAAQPAGVSRSPIDPDSNHYPSPPVVLPTADADLAQDVGVDPTRLWPTVGKVSTETREPKPMAPFSDSLITGPDLDG